MIRWFKNFMKLRNKNCIYCLLWPLLFFDLSTAIIFRCTHAANEIKRRFRVSKTRLLFSLLVISGQIISISKNVKRFQSTNSTHAKVVIAGDMLFMAMQLCMFVFNLTLGGRKIKMFASYQHLSDISPNFKITSMFTNIDAKIIRGQVIGFLSVNAAMTVVVAVILGLKKTCWDFSCNVVDAAKLFGSLSLMIIQYQSLNEILLYKTFHAKFGNKVKSSISKKMCDDDESIFSLRNMNLEHELKTSRRLYDNLTKLVEQISKFYGLELLLWYFFVIAIVGVNFYILVLKLYRGDAMNDKDVEFVVKMVSCCGFTVYYTFKIQGMADCGDELSSFLFQYPIGKLSQMEALQVEALLTALHIQPPTINVMDSYTVGIKLLAPIGGASITYVLVALQFYSSE